MNELVPFGKYKGQPVEQLRNDPNYVEWLLAQPWFAQRFGGIKTLIVNNFKEPDETPAHNRIQARFLCKDYAYRVAKAAYPGVFSEVDDWRYFVTCYQIAIEKKYGQDFEQIEFSETALKVSCEFETKEGWDVGIRVYGDVQAKGLRWERVTWFEPKIFRRHVYVEIKPAVGDEFPRILRDVKCRSGDGIVFADEFIAEGASLDQVKAMFDSSHRSLVLSSELKPGGQQHS